MPSRSKLTQLRIKDEDLLTPDDLLLGDYAGKRIRTRASAQGHVLSPDRRTAECGMPLDIWDTTWDEYRQFFMAAFGEEMDPGEWFIVVDTRKGDKCSACGHPQPASRWREAEPPTSYDEDVQPTSFDGMVRSPAESKSNARLLSKAAWAARELGASII